jgi:hypothetical protein
MTMTPESFRDELDRATDAAPPAPPVVTDLEAGRARLRRHRRTTAAAVAAAVVVVAVGVAVAARGGSEDRGADPIAPPTTSQGPVEVPYPAAQWTSDRIVAACDLPSGYFDARPRVVTSTATADQVLAAFANSDGRYWAGCTIPIGDPETDAATVVPYDSQGEPPRGFSSTVAAGCPRAEWSSCRLYSYGSVDRVLPQVAGVEVGLANGDTVAVPTTDGYYAINLLLPLPTGASFDEEGRLTGLSSTDLVNRITYLDRFGSPLAAAMLDGSGGGDSGMEVDGLPVAFDAYPSLRGEF